MSAALAAPLLPSALVVVACALAGGVFGVLLALGLAMGCGALAVASTDRRRLIWIAACASAVGLAARSGLPDLPLPALPALPTLEAQRELLARPIGLLVPAPESAILLGIVLGERAQIPRELSAAFAASGTTHLLAISGFNMTLVGGAVALALRGRVRPSANAILATCAILLYSALVGPAASVLRAALMSSVAAFGIATGRRAATANALCAAVTLMLLLDPTAVGDVGLQLSALATAGLVLLQPAVARRIGAIPSPAREGIATTLAATLPTLPVIAGVFGRISLVSPLSNLVCVPLFPILMLSGAATSLTGVVSLDLARPVALLAFAAAFTLRTAVEAFAAIPLASLSVPDGPITGALFAVVEIAAIRWGGALRSFDITRLRPLATRVSLSPRLAAVVLGVALTPVAVAAAMPVSTDAVRVIALDVGQGDAYLVELGGPLLLIDGGPDPTRLLDELGATLPPWRRRIDVVALTHAHTDHGAGLVALFDRYEVGLALEPEGLTPSILTDLWGAAIAKAGVPRRSVRAGDRVGIGGATIQVLAPDPDLLVDTPDLVLRVEHGAFSALFTGDAVEDAQLRLLERPQALRTRVYVPPHHGAATPYGEALRAAVAPEVALISVGAGNRYGHPTPETLAALSGIATYRTDQDGTVEISLDGTVLVARTHANGLPPPRRGFLSYPAAGG